MQVIIVIFQIPFFALCTQAECDELAQRAEALKEENATLRSEVSQIRSEYEQLRSENAALKVIFEIFIYFDFCLFCKLATTVAPTKLYLLSVTLI